HPTARASRFFAHRWAHSRRSTFFCRRCFHCIHSQWQHATTTQPGQPLPTHSSPFYWRPRISGSARTILGHHKLHPNPRSKICCNPHARLASHSVFARDGRLTSCSPLATMRRCTTALSGRPCRVRLTAPSTAFATVAACSLRDRCPDRPAGCFVL